MMSTQGEDRQRKEKRERMENKKRGRRQRNENGHGLSTDDVRETYERRCPKMRSLATSTITYSSHLTHWVFFDRDSVTDKTQSEYHAKKGQRQHSGVRSSSTGRSVRGHRKLRASPRARDAHSEICCASLIVGDVDAHPLTPYFTKKNC